MSHYSNTLNNSQIFGDGEQVVIIFKEEGTKAEVAYQLKQPQITTVHLSCGEEEVPTYVLGGRSNIIIGEPHGSVALNIDMFCTQENLSTHYAEDGGLMFDLDLFKNVSVADLFKAINKKLSKRKI